MYGVVPGGVEGADERREGDALVVEGRGDTGWVGGDAVVVCVEGFDEVIVHFGVEEGGGGGLGGEAEAVGDDGLGKVFVN